ncbi:sigma-70 family RNA polymerase sigma factor [Erythrobacter sp. Alg231-14]|uniref:sigma-70 family RNA polymerase sigma factor n=1 Tax=Erythrobacter sp. Alg231-14 TaxID=1922225 RepID=UPI000D553BE2
MKHDHASFSGARAYITASRGEVEDRVRRFMPMVHRAAWHVYGMGHAGLEVEDLVQAGVVALTECAQRHNAPTEDGFAAYAKIRARGAMIDVLRRQMNDTRTARKKRARYNQAVENVRAQTGADPTRGEIAKTLGVSDSELLDIEASAITLTSISDEYDDANTAFASEEPDPFEVLCGQEDRDRLIAAMTELPDRLKLVLQLFFVEELNLTEIAEVLEVSVPRVHQLRSKALKDLRGLMDAS